MTITLTKSARSARKAKGDGHIRHAEILDAAERIFVRDGYQGATIRKIADEVGVSPTAFYMHFHDKDEILHAICEGAVGTLLARNSAISVRPLDAVGRVRQMLDAYMRFGLDNPNTYGLAVHIAASQSSPATAEVVTDLGARCYARFKSAVADIAAEGRLRISSVDSAAQILWGGCHGIVALRIARPQFDWADDETLISGMLDSLFRGLVAD